MLLLTLTDAGKVAVDIAARTMTAVQLKGYTLDYTVGPPAGPSYVVGEKVWDGPMDDFKFFLTPDVNVLRARLRLPAPSVDFGFGRLFLWGVLSGSVICFGTLHWDVRHRKNGDVPLDIFFDLQEPNIGRVIDFDPVLNALRALPDELRENPFWRDFGNAVSDVLDTFVDGPRRQLRHIRDADYLPRKLQIRSLRQKGINFFSDTLSIDDIVRLNRFVGLYWPGKSTKEFDRFLSYFLNIRVDLTQLWNDTQTDVFNVFEDKPLGLKLWEGGSWWPTSHIKATFDVENNPNLKIDDLVKLFYILAPIQLVLYRVIRAVYGTTTVHAIARGLVRTWEFGPWPMDSNCEICCTQHVETEE